MDKWQDVFDLWKAGKTAFTGVSDSAMGFHLGEILDKAAPRTLIIERSIRDVENSLAQIGYSDATNYCDILKIRIDAFRNHPLVALVHFDSLNDPDVVAACMRHLMPDNPVDMVRIDQLMDQNIQVDISSLSESCEGKDLPALMGIDVWNQLRPKILEKR